MTLDEWFRAASEDAERRQLPELVPRLAALAAATRQLRAADWNREPDPPPTTEAQAPGTANGFSDRNREPDPPPPTKARAPKTANGFSGRNREPDPPPTTDARSPGTANGRSGRNRESAPSGPTDEP